MTRGMTGKQNAFIIFAELILKETRAKEGSFR
jgi:hypothetical protein